MKIRQARSGLFNSTEMTTGATASAFQAGAQTVMTTVVAPGQVYVVTGRTRARRRAPAAPVPCALSSRVAMLRQARQPVPTDASSAPVGDDMLARLYRADAAEVAAIAAGLPEYARGPWPASVKRGLAPVAGSGFLQ